MKASAKGWRKALAIVTVFSMVLALFAGLPTHAKAATGTAADYDTMRTNWVSFLTGGTYDITDPDVSAKVTSITNGAQSVWNSMDKTSGRTALWSDLSSKSNTANITNTYGRLRNMALAYRTPGSSLQNNASLLADIVSGLDWLNANNWYSTSITLPTGPQSVSNNWWDWEIGTPLYLKDIVALLYDQLTSTQRSTYLAAIDHFVGDCSKDLSTTGSGTSKPATGANLAWKCSIQLLRGVLLQDDTTMNTYEPMISPLFDNITSTSSTNDGGFFADGSYIQHVDIAYNGGYGLALLDTISGIVYLLSGSPFAYTNSNVNNMYQWIYNSFQPLIYDGAMMDTVRGREISRNGSANGATGISDPDHQKSQSLIKTMVTMLQYAPSADAANYKKIIKGIIQSDTYSNFMKSYAVSLYSITPVKNILNDATITGITNQTTHRTYASMDRIAHQRPTYAFGIGMYSTRIANYESINGENLHGWYTGSGTTYLYTQTDQGQYDDNYWPTVNPYRMPGTTVDTMTRANGSNQGTKSSQDWVGGVTLDGQYGAAGMVLYDVASPLTGKKSWFMFDNEMVALGASITDTSANPVETIVDNRKIAGSEALTVNGTAKPTTLGWSETMSGVNWIQLGTQNIGYYFPGGATINGLRETRTGSWHDINNGGSTTSISRNYLTLYMNHGAAPTNQTYSYVVLPNMTSAQVSSYAANPDVSILRNDADVQAVQQKSLGIVAANFWNNNVVTVPANGDLNYLTSNAKASVMVKDTSAGLDVAVSDPTQINTGTIQITLNTPSAGVISQDENVTVTQLYPKTIFTVNVSGSAGKSYSVVFSKPTMLTPTADSYTYDVNPTTNYGTAFAMAVKGATGTSNRHSFLKFDLSSIPDGATYAKLRLYATNTTNANNTTLTAYNTASDTWTETGITWNNEPAISGSAIGSGVANGTGQYIDIDVSSYINAQIAGDKIASIELRDDAKLGNYIDVKARECGPSLEPELIVVRPVVNAAPVADSYTWQANPNNNYGFAASIPVKAESGTNNRHSFMKYDLSAFGSIKSAKLRFYAQNDGTGTVPVSAYGTSTDAWTEDGITWNNQPLASGAALGSASVTTTAQYYEIDVTSYVQAQIAGDKVASFVLEDTTNSGQYIAINSKESSANPPQLQITR